MSYSKSISFHGVSRIEIGETQQFERNGVPWQSLTLWLFDAEDHLADSISFHSVDGAKLAVEFERKAVAA